MDVDLSLDLACACVGTISELSPRTIIMIEYCDNLRSLNGFQSFAQSKCFVIAGNRNFNVTVCSFFSPISNGLYGTSHRTNSHENGKTQHKRTRRG